MVFKFQNVLVVGVGFIGEHHVRSFQATCRADVSICDTNPETLNRVKSEYQIENAFSDIDEAMQQSFQAVVIATPTDSHIDLAIQAAKAGYHVLIESPLSTKLNRVDELAEIGNENNLQIAVAYAMRSHPSLIAMKEALDDGRYGKPRQSYFTSGQNFPLYRPSYHRDRKTCGGAIHDSLTHGLNLGEWLLGPIDRLAADAHRQHLDSVGVEDTVNVIGRHDEVLASYTLNQYQAPNETILTVVCQHGTVRFENHNNQWKWMTKPGAAWRDEPLEDIKPDAIFVRQANHFLDVMEGKKIAACSLEEGIQTLNANLAVLDAVENQNWVSLHST